MKKRFLITVFILCLVFSMASANETHTLKLRAEEISSAPAGKTVAVNISLEDNPGIAVLAFNVEYDEKYITLNSVTHYDEVFKKNNFTPGDISKNPYNVLALNASSNRTEDGKLISMNFYIKEDCPGGVYDIRLSNAECYNIDEEEIVCDVQSITITVEGDAPSDDSADNTGTPPEDSYEILPEEDEEDIPTDAPEDNPDTGHQTKPTVSFGSGSTKNTQTEKNDNDSKTESKPYTIQNSIVLTIGKKAASVFGDSKESDVAPVLRNSRTMLPARFVAENLGAKVLWSDAERKVSITKDKVEIIIYIGSQKAYVNGKEEILDSPAFIENDRTYTPLRFVAEKLGAKVYWEADTQNVIIEKNGMQ